MSDNCLLYHPTPFEVVWQRYVAAIRVGGRTPFIRVIRVSPLFTIMLPHLFTLTLTLAAPLVSAALYPKDSLVKMIDAKGFRNVLQENRTSVVAFVASWCGYCKAMVPEYSKAALGLYPLIPLYAVDCDENRSLCAEQDVKGFPTVKLFPRGKEQTPILFEHPDRTASAFFYFATRRVPHKNLKLRTVTEIKPWVNDKIGQNRVLLLTEAKNIPLMWKVLANKYRDDFAFATHRDRKGQSAVALGYDAKESKLLVFPSGSSRSVLFEGVLKYNSISEFLDSILDGTANLAAPNSKMPEKEIERKQEAQRIALLHGGFSDIIDFEKAIEEHGTDFHGAHGYTSRPGDTLKTSQTGDSNEGKEDTYEQVEDPIYRAIRIQLEKAREAKNTPTHLVPVAGDIDQVILELHSTVEPATLSTAINPNTPPPTSVSEGVSDQVVSSYASPVKETEALPTQERATTLESGQLKDEL
ncbi:hypothetical protein F5148DRAFT_1182614 [Russula earlei]|uniref:Uncharacterized protein n=1 Tax=Russula earlei TaxID=71964 RepID=A0ACC0UEG3_9AGAM|nr:hypothetical protein F5148DRAFT_1182614 [Russula earlei]